MFNFIHASPNAFQADLNNITVLEPQRRFPARAYALRSNHKISPIFEVQAGTSTYVPVNIKSPGRRVVPRLRKLIVFATPKIMSLVLLSCTVFPLTFVVILRA